MPPEYVRPSVKAQKNDDRDAGAIAEAATRPTMRFVELKLSVQLDMQIHRARDRLVAEGIELINQLRAVLMDGARHRQSAGPAQAEPGICRRSWRAMKQPWARACGY